MWVLMMLVSTAKLPENDGEVERRIKGTVPYHAGVGNGVQADRTSYSSVEVVVTGAERNSDAEVGVDWIIDVGVEYVNFLNVKFTKVLKFNHWNELLKSWNRRDSCGGVGGGAVDARTPDAEINWIEVFMRVVEPKEFHMLELKLGSEETGLRLDLEWSLLDVLF